MGERENGYNPAEQEATGIEKIQNIGQFVEGLKTSNYSNEEFKNIRDVLSEISREL